MLCCSLLLSAQSPPFPCPNCASTRGGEPVVASSASEPMLLRWHRGQEAVTTEARKERPTLPEDHHHNVLSSWRRRLAALHNGACCLFQSVAQATCLELRSDGSTSTVTSSNLTSWRVASRHTLSDISPPPHGMASRELRGIGILGDNELRSNTRPGVREHLNQRCGLANAKCP